jgi:catechol 2,3-dioxygenase-like lactoylglutathione lyase family enzyme
MFLPKTHIHLGVGDAGESVEFYQALLGAPPSRKSDHVAVFEFDSPPLVLTLEAHPLAAPGGGAMSRRRAAVRRRGSSPSEFALLVSEPQQVGMAAIALRRAGVRLRLEDRGIEARDPDGNAWRVRFVPSTTGRSVVATKEDGRGEEAPR